MLDYKKLYQSKTFLLILIVLLPLASQIFPFGAASPASSSFSYVFSVDKQGATTAVINYSSTYSDGSSWVIVPKDWNATPIVVSGLITSWRLVDTLEVVGESYYFYRAYKFTYQSNSSTGFFNMTIGFNMDTGALVIDDRGIFFSPLIGFDYPNGSGTAEVFFDSIFTINANNVIAVGGSYYNPSGLTANWTIFDLYEPLLRLQIELKTALPDEHIVLYSKNGVFKFSVAEKYNEYASGILNLYDEIYLNYTRLFNVTLNPPIEVQFFLPDFYQFLSVGGFTPFNQTGAGTININIFYIRAVNGTIEVIAAHELAHHFLIKSGISPNIFLWFHEGMSQFISISSVKKLGYEGATEEKNTLDEGSNRLVWNVGESGLGFVQYWTPYSSPLNVGNYYLASYYIVERLDLYYGRDFYENFFKLIRYVDVDSIEVLTLYMSNTANASVASSLQYFGFAVEDIWIPEFSPTIFLPLFIVLTIFATVLLKKNKN